MTIINQMFAWPQGIVVGNLIASFLIWFPAFTIHHFHIRKLHQKVDELLRLTKAQSKEVPK